MCHNTKPTEGFHKRQIHAISTMERIRYIVFTGRKTLLFVLLISAKLSTQSRIHFLKCFHCHQTMSVFYWHLSQRRLSRSLKVIFFKIQNSKFSHI